MATWICGRQSAENRALECLLDSMSDVLLSDDDEEGTEDDEGESETIFD